MPEDKYAHLKEMSEMLESIVLGVLEEHSESGFSDKPVVSEKTIHEYEGRMRVSALSKFEGPGYVGAVSFFLTEKNKESHDSLGAVVLYISQEDIEGTIKKLGKKVEEEEYDQCAEVCGEIAQGIVAQFLKKLVSAGYQAPITGEPIARRNDIAEGIDFNFKQYDKYEILFSDKGEVKVAIDVTLAPLHK